MPHEDKMSPKKSPTNSDEILSQKKDSVIHEKTVTSRSRHTSRENAMPPPFNPEYKEEKQEFMGDDIEASRTNAAALPSNISLNTAQQQQMPLRGDNPQPAHHLPQTTQLFQIPIATEVIPVPNEEVPGVTVGDDNRNIGSGNNNSAIDDDEDRKRRQRNKKLRCLFVIVISAAIVVIGNVMSNDSSNNNNNENDLDFSERAEPIKCGFSNISGNTTPEPSYNVPSCSGVPSPTNSVGSKGKWFSFSGDGSCVNLTTCDSYTDFDTRIRVFKFTTTGNHIGHCVAWNDDAFGGSSMCHPNSLQSMTSFAAHDGFMYYIFVDGFGEDANGNFVMSIDCGECPAVQVTPQPMTQPSSQPTIQPMPKWTSIPTTSPSKQPTPQPTFPSYSIKGTTIKIPELRIPTFVKPMQPRPTFPVLINPTRPIDVKITKNTESGSP